MDTIRWFFTMNDESEKKMFKNGTPAPDEYYPKGWDEAQPYENIPGPKPLPIIGNIWRFFPGGEYYNFRIDHLIKRFPEQYGNMVRFGGIIGRRDIVYLFDPADMEYVLKNSGPYPKREFMDALTYFRTALRKDIFCEATGLTSLHGEEWHKMRMVVNPVMMQTKRILQFTTQMDCTAKDFVHCIRRHVNETGENKTGQDFETYLYKWALEAVAVVALNKRLGTLDENLDKNSEIYKFMKAILLMFEQMYYLEMLPPYWKYIPSKHFNEFVENMDFILSTVVKLTNESFQNAEDEDIPDNELSILQKLAKVDRNIAFTMTHDMLIAGIDTTGKTLGATLYFLAKNPDKQDKLREEILKFLPYKDSVVTTECFSKMPYLKAVVKESTRIAPISVGTLRTTTENMVVGGYQIPVGTDLFSMHFHSSLSEEYLEEPTKFIPERWLRSTTINDEYSFKKMHTFTSMPFGFGSRSCVGKRLANLELEVALSNIIRNFEFSWEQPDLEFGCKMLYSFMEPLKFTVKELD